MDVSVAGCWRSKFDEMTSENMHFSGFDEVAGFCEELTFWTWESWFDGLE